MCITHTKKPLPTGFSLIELMIVVAIIGVLASLALPAYQNYITKSRFADVVTSAQGVKTALSICLMEQGGVIENCDSYQELSINAPPATNNLAEITIAAGTAVITATATVEAGSYNYILTPSSNNQQISFAVSGSCSAAKLC